MSPTVLNVLAFGRMPASNNTNQQPPLKSFFAPYLKPLAKQQTSMTPMSPTPQSQKARLTRVG
jgi:hypothetical protein